MKSKFSAQLQQGLKNASSFVEKKMMRDFAHKYGLVYFGTMHKHSDEYELVRGITLHTAHQDRHFTVGNYNGRDVTILQRQVLLSHPHHESAFYKWSILQVDLQRRVLPHLLITAHHDDRLFFDNLQIKLANFQQVTPSLIPNPDFARHFRVFATTEALDQLPTVLSPEVMAALVHHFKNFDVEMFEDQIIVYTAQSRVTPMLLQELLREGLWLAERLDLAPTLVL
jgi:hypothetical protein